MMILAVHSPDQEPDHLQDQITSPLPAHNHVQPLNHNLVLPQTHINGVVRKEKIHGWVLHLINLLPSQLPTLGEGSQLQAHGKVLHRMTITNLLPTGDHLRGEEHLDRPLVLASPMTPLAHGAIVQMKRVVRSTATIAMGADQGAAGALKLRLMAMRRYLRITKRNVVRVLNRKLLDDRCLLLYW
jgi:hypothetical protein